MNPLVNIPIPRFTLLTDLGPVYGVVQGEFIPLSGEDVDDAMLCWMSGQVGIRALVNNN